MFAAVGASPAFAALISTWGATNLSGEFSADSMGVPWTHYTFERGDRPRGRLYGPIEHRSGNLTSSAGRGPVLLSSPAGGSYGGLQLAGPTSSFDGIAPSERPRLLRMGGAAAVTAGVPFVSGADVGAAASSDTGITTRPRRLRA